MIAASVVFTEGGTGTDRSSTVNSALRNRIFDVTETIAGSNSLEEIVDALRRAVGEFGFTSIGINELPPPTKGADPLILVEVAPEGFRDFFIKERFYLIDHIGAYARRTYEAFRFSDAPYPRKEAARHRRFMQALQTFGLGAGLVVPIGRPNNMPACIWLAGERADLHEEPKHAVQPLALFAATKAFALHHPPPPLPSRGALTVRERDVLQWISAGKTSWEIGSISGRSERSVNKAIADAMVKMDAVTRTQAVVNAIRIGEIKL
jgi:LuxR family transcriptional regulator, quorum-sensing system regulator BjaR1